MSANVSIAISGAGISGLAPARALLRRAILCTIYEKSSPPTTKRRHNYGMTLSPRLLHLSLRSLKSHHPQPPPLNLRRHHPRPRAPLQSSPAPHPTPQAPAPRHRLGYEVGPRALLHRPPPHKAHSEPRQAGRQAGTKLRLRDETFRPKGDF